MKDGLLIFSGNPKAGSTWLGGLFSGVAIEMGMNFFYGQYAIPKNHTEIIQGEYDMVISQSSNYQKLLELNKSYKCIHVIRDPRDVCVSSYYSYKNTHNVEGWPALKELRERVTKMNFEEGMLETIRFNNYFIETLKNWNYNDPNNLELKYEDIIWDPERYTYEMIRFLGLTNEEQLNGVGSTFKGIYNRILYRHNYFYKNFKINQKYIPHNRVKAINNSLSFNNLTKGRKRGSENINSHYRKGVSGDWKNKFSKNIKNVFKEKHGDLLIHLGYERDHLW